MTYRIFKVNSEDYSYIEEIPDIQSINWQDNGLGSVFLSFDFTTSKKLECGDWIALYEKDDNEIVFYGTIFKITQKAESEFQYHGYDLGYYLEKNETVIQFKGETVSDAITKVCTKGELKVAFIPKISQTVVKIYQKEALSDILKSIYKIGVTKGLKDIYYFDCRNGYVNLLKYEENNDLRGYIANLYSIKSFDNITSFEKTSSIENLKNRVEVYTQIPANKKDKEQGKKLVCAQKEESIKKYGLLNHIEEVDADKKINPESIAKSKLDELNKVVDTISFDVIADHKLHKGVITTIENEDINISGSYKVLSSIHSIAGTVENVHVVVEKYTQEA